MWHSICTNRQPFSDSQSNGNLQPAYYADYAACWTSVKDDSGMSKSSYYVATYKLVYLPLISHISTILYIHTTIENMVLHSNSMWDERNEWHNDVAPKKQGKCKSD